MKSFKVKKAYEKYWEKLKKELQSKNIDALHFDVYLRSFKHEKQLEVWVKNKSSNSYILLKTIPVCASSGDLGPKRQQGDGQVPEGFYDIPLINPYGNYHLAIKVGYPNKSDKLLATSKDPGGDIFIHGKCCTIGCLPLTDEPVEELYILCLETMNRNRKVKIDIFPCRFSKENETMLAKYENPQTQTFWKNLKKAYDHFELNHSLPAISVDEKGNYIVSLK